MMFLNLEEKYVKTKKKISLLWIMQSRSLTLQRLYNNTSPTKKVDCVNTIIISYGKRLCETPIFKAIMQ